MEKLSHATESVIDENVEKLAELFPEVVTEVREPDGRLRHTIDVDALKARVGDVAEGQRERYQFTWPGKREAKQEAYRQIDKCLRPCPEESVNWDTTGNLYIEGDNLDALKLLRNTYAGKVKMIYIDPPYNTGHDFIYDDDFAQTKADYDVGSGDYDEEGGRLVANPESNGRFHSDWCSMMYPRLLLARDLLSEDGAIFISIDDGEVKTLREISDSIFGGKNFRNQLLVRRRIKSLNVQFADNGLRSFNVGYEYVLVYSRSSKFLFNPLRMKKVDAKKTGTWNVFWSNADRPSMRYELLGFTPESGQWRWSKELAIDAVKNYEAYLREEKATGLSLEDYWQRTGERLRFVRRISDGYGKNGGVQYWVPPSDTSLRTSNWTDIEVSQIAKEIKLPFDNPKNVSLVEEVLRSATNPDSLVLDFFSGSATTAHAVMRLNAEDGGNRKFIMVQLPEPCNEKSEAAKAGYGNICEIGKERIRRAGKKIAVEVEDSNRQLKLGEEPKRVPDIGFRVLQIDSSNFEDVSAEPSEFFQDAVLKFADNLKLDRTPDDLIIQVMLKKQIELSAPIEKLGVDGCTVFSVDSGRLVACFDKDVPVEVMTAMAKMEPDYAVMRDASFAGDDAVSNFAEIFKNYSSITEVEVI